MQKPQDLSMAAMDTPTCAPLIVVGETAPELERYAAAELARYLTHLFGLRPRLGSSVAGHAGPAFLLGSPATNPELARTVPAATMPRLSDQGYTLRRLDASNGPLVLVGGGSPRSTLWAVHELAECWGVRHLLHEDILPAPGEFQLPALDRVREPVLRQRFWTTIGDLALRTESWGMADYRPVFDQLAKLRLNRIVLGMAVWMPYLHLEVDGIARRQAWLWYDEHYPLTDDMIGRSLFDPAATEFWNPDLPCGAAYAELLQAGQTLAHGIMAYAHQRGMETIVPASLLEYPPEFAPLLRNCQKIRQLGQLTIVPGADMDIHDPALSKLARAVVRATLETYPEADYLAPAGVEFRQWTGQFETAWQELDRKYGIRDLIEPEALLAAAAARDAKTPATARAVDDVKGDLVALRFYDHLFDDLRILADTARPEIPLLFGISASELLPIFARVLPKSAEFLISIDYTPQRDLASKSLLRHLQGCDRLWSVNCTLQDDNIGVVPQLTADALEELLAYARGCGCTGFWTRYFMTGDHETSVALLARSAWDPAADLTRIRTDHVRAVYGAACIDALLAMYRELEATTKLLERHALSFSFPVPGMLLKYWDSGPTPDSLPNPAQLAAILAGYERALDLARTARLRTEPQGRRYAEYWTNRLEFAVQYCAAVARVRAAAQAEAAGDRARALELGLEALELVAASLEAYACAVVDQSDRGAIAVLNEHAYRALSRKLAALKEEYHGNPHRPLSEPEPQPPC